MGSLIAAAEALAESLRGKGVSATHDPAKAAAARATVYVEPPAVDYRTRLMAWQLVAVTAQPSGSLAALADLDELVQGVLASGLPIETATPTAYTLTLAAPARPAFLMTMTQTGSQT